MIRVGESDAPLRVETEEQLSDSLAGEPELGRDCNPSVGEAGISKTLRQSALRLGQGEAAAIGARHERPTSIRELSI